MASECESAKLPVTLMQTDASASVAAFHRFLIVILSGERERWVLCSLFAARELILDVVLWSSVGVGERGRAL